MPIYDFECDVCGHTESDQLVNNNEPYPCTECQERNKNKTTQSGLMQPKITAPSRTKSRWGDTFSNRI